MARQWVGVVEWGWGLTWVPLTLPSMHCARICAAELDVSVRGEMGVKRGRGLTRRRVQWWWQWQRRQWGWSQLDERREAQDGGGGKEERCGTICATVSRFGRDGTWYMWPLICTLRNGVVVQWAISLVKALESWVQFLDISLFYSEFYHYY